MIYKLKLANCDHKSTEWKFGLSSVWTVLPDKGSFSGCESYYIYSVYTVTTYRYSRIFSQYPQSLIVNIKIL
jgi:hypothetical protein